MEKLELFPSNLYATDIEYDDSIVDKIIHLKNNTVSENKSNEGGWQSPVYDVNDNEFLSPLIKEIKEKLSFVYDDCNRISSGIFKYWINVNSPGNYNVKHRHAGAFMSGCFYIKVPNNSGNIIFHNPNPLLGIPSKFVFDGKTSNIFSVTPTEKMLLIFPVSLDHEVSVNNSNETRISLAFNFI